MNKQKNSLKNMVEKLILKIILIYYFIKTRYFSKFNVRERLDIHQKNQIKKFIKKNFKQSNFYQPYQQQDFNQLPIIDKQFMLAHFDQINTANITLEQATKLALNAEQSRDFDDQLNGYTVGLSSGTQGTRGVFLASNIERNIWAGIMLARALPKGMAKQLLFGKPLKIAFFLRANSKLYDTIKSKRIDFQFYDLYLGVDQHLQNLQNQSPDMIVAPARVLAYLANLKQQQQLPINPKHIISVAEVLEPDDINNILLAFGVKAHQLYQATEGFLGYTCSAGNLHLNEEFVYIEKEWLDHEKTRFIPIITDFTRTTQLMVRYRLNDILHISKEPCPCGNVSTTLTTIEGRSDDVLWFKSQTQTQLIPIFPDVIRHAIYSSNTLLPDYEMIQEGNILYIAIEHNQPIQQTHLKEILIQLCQRFHLAIPEMIVKSFTQQDFATKRRRIRCQEKPII